MIYILLSTLWLFPGFAQNTVDHVIERSTQEIIRKDREQALKILTNKLEEKNLPKDQKEKLAKAIKVAAEIFFTDRGQSLYEAGRNRYLISPREAISRMEEAKGLEGENSLILWTLVKSRLKDQQCEQAKQDFHKIPKMIRTQKSEFEPLYFYCKSEPLAFWTDDKLDEFYQHFFKGVFLYWKGAQKEASLELDKAKKLKPEFTETYYWLWRIDPTEKDYALKYKRDCESRRIQLTKKFEDFPQLCQFVAQVAEVEVNNGVD